MVWGRKGQLAIYLVVIVMMTIIVFVGAVVAPFGVRFSTEMFEEGEKLVVSSNASLQSISDADFRGAVQDVVDSANTASTQNVEVFGGLYKYSWVLALVLVGLVGFMFTRRQVEYGLV